MENNAGITSYYHVTCYDKDGNLKWEDGFKNLVVTTGRNQYLDATLKTGVTSPLWYVGLKGTGTVVAGDTAASHGGWAELTIYSQSTRPQWVSGTISAGSLANSSAAVFTINAGGTVAGAMMINNNTKGGTTGILLSAGDFASARTVISGDTLNITITCTMTSS
jgi:hypothetical protein